MTTQYNIHRNKALQYKTIHGWQEKTIQDNIRQYKSRQGKIGQQITRQCNTIFYNIRQYGTTQNETI